MPMAPRDVPASVSLDALDMLSVYEGCKCRNVKEKYSRSSLGGCRFSDGAG